MYFSFLFVCIYLCHTWRTAKLIDIRERTAHVEGDFLSRVLIYLNKRDYLSSEKEKLHQIRYDKKKMAQLKARYIKSGVITTESKEKNKNLQAKF